MAGRASDNPSSPCTGWDQRLGFGAVRSPALQSMTPEGLVDCVSGVELAEARKIVSAVFRDRGIGEPVTGVRRIALERVRSVACEPRLEVIESATSPTDRFARWLLESSDGERFETVRIPLERAGRYSACVSSQVGCALACRFCATGELGLTRNLETWEIVEQVRVVARSIAPGEGRVHGVVFQGMGEPLSNTERVIDAIAVLSEPSALRIDARNITVCTAGLPTGIRRLADALPKVRIGWSVSSALADRAAYMPIERAHPTDAVIDALVEHAKKSGIAPMWALTLLRGKNDTPEHARAFGELVRTYTRRSGLRPRVTIVPYNARRALDEFSRQAEAEQARFIDALREHGVYSHVRYSGGSDVRAACGQLVAGRSGRALPVV